MFCYHILSCVRFATQIFHLSACQISGMRVGPSRQVRITHFRVVHPLGYEISWKYLVGLGLGQIVGQWGGYIYIHMYMYIIPYAHILSIAHCLLFVAWCLWRRPSCLFLSVSHKALLHADRSSSESDLADVRVLAVAA